MWSWVKRWSKLLHSDLGTLSIPAVFLLPSLWPSFFCEVMHPVSSIKQIYLGYIIFMSFPLPYFSPLLTISPILFVKTSSIDTATQAYNILAYMISYICTISGSFSQFVQLYSKRSPLLVYITSLWRSKNPPTVIWLLSQACLHPFSLYLIVPWTISSFPGLRRFYWWDYSSSITPPLCLEVSGKTLFGDIWQLVRVQYLQ